jgi:hypothetical protein
MGNCFQQTSQTWVRPTVFSKKQCLPRPERGGGQVLFFEGSWLGLLERLWFVAPFLFGAPRAAPAIPNQGNRSS